MSLCRPLLVLSLLLVLLTVPDAAFGQSGAVEGVISDSTTGVPVSRATVRLADSFRGASADEAGEYRLSLEAGRYVLVVQAVGYEPQRRRVRIAEGETKTVDVQMAPETYQRRSRPPPCRRRTG